MVPTVVPTRGRRHELLLLLCLGSPALLLADPAAECARAMGRNNEEKCESMPCCIYDPNSQRCLVRSELAFCDPYGSQREKVEENVKCVCPWFVSRVTLPCLPNVGCDWWWGIFVAGVISLCVSLWWRFRACFREFCTSRNIRGGSQCSQCSNHLAAGAQFCPQCNGRTDALEPTRGDPLPDLRGGCPGDLEGSPALTGSRTQAAGGFSQPSAATAFGAGCFGQPAANTFGGSGFGQSAAFGGERAQVSFRD